jgi:acetyl-CoA carboxylase biotin carboxyl carrier protein
MELKELFELLDRFEESSLSELRLKTEVSSVVLKRGGETHVVAPAGPQQAQQFGYGAGGQGAPPQAPAPQQAPAGAPDSDGAGEDMEYITSPIVATFYRSPAPDAPPFVDEGTRVATGDTLCVLEAMKVMNELEAEFDLEVVRILVQNGEMVEYGTPIFEVKRV